MKIKPSSSSNSVKLNVSSATSKTPANSNAKVEVKLAAPKSEPVVNEKPLFDFDSATEDASKPNENFFETNLFPAFTPNNDPTAATVAAISNPTEREQSLENVFLSDQTQIKNDTGKIDKNSIMALYKNSNNNNIGGVAPVATMNSNNNHMFNNVNVMPNQLNNLVKQQQANLFTNNATFEFTTNNPMMPQGYAKPAQQTQVVNNTFPVNFNNNSMANHAQPNTMNLVNV